MVVSWNDVMVAQERHRDLLKAAEAHRTGTVRAGSQRQLIAGRAGAVAVQALGWLGSRFVSVREVMQRRYAG